MSSPWYWLVVTAIVVIVAGIGIIYWWQGRWKGRVNQMKLLIEDSLPKRDAISDELLIKSVKDRWRGPWSDEVYRAALHQLDVEKGLTTGTTYSGRTYQSRSDAPRHRSPDSAAVLVRQ